MAKKKSKKKKPSFDEILKRGQEYLDKLPDSEKRDIAANEFEEILKKAVKRKAPR